MQTGPPQRSYHAISIVQYGRHRVANLLPASCLMTALVSVGRNLLLQRISQLYLHTPRSSANGITTPAFAFPAEAGTHYTYPEGWKAELALGGWFFTYWNTALKFYIRRPCCVPAPMATTLSRWWRRRLSNTTELWSGSRRPSSRASAISMSNTFRSTYKRARWSSASGHTTDTW